MRAPPFVLCWGELLWDEFDSAGEQRELGGCASNVAVHLARLGVSVSLVSRVGKDALGELALGRLKGEGVDTTSVQLDEELATARVRVDVSEAEPRYSMICRMDWSRLRLHAKTQRRLSDCAAVAYGTLAQRSPMSAGRLQALWGSLPKSCVRVCDLNLRGQVLPAERLRECVSAATVVKLNEHELQLLQQQTNTKDGIQWLLAHERVELVALTLGGRGAELHRRNGVVRASAASLLAQPGEAASTVGAGDAFCARLVAGILEHQPDAELAAACNAYAASAASRRAAI